MILEIARLVSGLSLIAYSSSKTVEYSSQIANAFKIPTIIIGLFIISLGTDLPEIANSIYSSYTGHGDINVGNILGSCLTQITLSFGLVAILGGVVIAKRKNIIVMGGSVIAATLLATLMVLDGAITQFDAGILILGYAVLLFISNKYTVREIGGAQVSDIYGTRTRLFKTALMLLLSLVGVTFGAIVIVDAVMGLSGNLGIPEYFVSFFAIGIGTSLPELSVSLAAVRKKKFGIVTGNILGSNIVDATLALGIGPLLFPTVISSEIIVPLAIFAVFASTVTVALFAWKEKIDKRIALILLMLYLISYLFIL
ncbi:TPA: sodium:calcium antiporter [Candidatus Micrarchaeota archaeon]|nr:sodium:calcium antiporter [Candidatus Micrarchaeota archaeon]